MKFLDVTLNQREPEKVEEVVTKPKYNWQYENNINSGNIPIDFDSPLEFKYNQWRTNGSLSNHNETIFHSNFVNLNYHLSDKLHYHFLYYSIRKAKRFGKKKTEEDKRKEKLLEAEREEINLIRDFYKYNVQRAKEALKILTKEQVDIIRKLQEKGG